MRNIADSLKPGGIFCLTTLNGYWVIRIMTTENNEDDRFDPLRCTCSDAHEHLGRMYQGIERAYIVPELLKMHAEVGLEVLHVYGGTTGNWGRRPLELDEVEVMLISRKTEPKLPQTHSV
ncbi:MAG: hypothetical protein JW934_14520 [Anaerolineae bacterium]|nr:hypothetical protein [Anaerolineae bacterium]